jgi:CRISPR/Cas system-associated endonuclease Cas1
MAAAFGHHRGARGDDRSNFLSGLLTDAIVLHCDERYQPCGWTAPLARTVDLKTFQNQTAKPKRLNEKLWHEMLRGKTLNQSRVLQHKQLRSPHLELALMQEVEKQGKRRKWQRSVPRAREKLRADWEKTCKLAERE